MGLPLELLPMFRVEVHDCAFFVLERGLDHPEHMRHNPGFEVNTDEGDLDAIDLDRLGVYFYTHSANSHVGLIKYPGMVHVTQSQSVPRLSITVQLYRGSFAVNSNPL